MSSLVGLEKSSNHVDSFYTICGCVRLDLKLVLNGIEGDNVVLVILNHSDERLNILS